MNITHKPGRCSRYTPLRRSASCTIGSRQSSIISSLDADRTPVGSFSALAITDCDRRRDARPDSELIELDVLPGVRCASSVFHSAPRTQTSGHPSLQSGEIRRRMFDSMKNRGERVSRSFRSRRTGAELSDAPELSASSLSVFRIVRRELRERELDAPSHVMERSAHEITLSWIIVRQRARSLSKCFGANVRWKSGCD